MWTTHHDAETSADASAVWAALRTLHSGTAIGPNSDSFEPHGPFAVGTRVTVTPQGQGAMESVITELEPNVVYADLTRFGELELTFRHTLRALPGGGTAVTHALEISGAGSDEIGPELGPQISGDFPQTMTELLSAAEHGIDG